MPGPGEQPELLTFIPRCVREAWELPGTAAPHGSCLVANCPILGEIHTQTFYTAQDYLGNQINCENHCSSLKNLPCSQDLPVPVQSAPGQAREAGSLQLLRWELGFGQSSLPALGFSFSCQPKKQEEFSSKHEKKEGLKKENVMVGEIRINFSTTSNLCSSQALCTIHPPPL